MRQRGETTVDIISDEKISGLSLDRHSEADNYGYQTPPWIKAASKTIEKKSQTKLTILQWIRDRVVKIVTRIPFNKIRNKSTAYAFTCKNCGNRGNRVLWMNRSELFGGTGKSGLHFLSEGTRLKQALPVRCRSCNTNHARYKRARRAMEKITDDIHQRPGLQAWFVTLTKPNVIYEPGEVVDIEADKEHWIAEFRRFRQRKIWKETFAGGYWFYEYTVHSPGDKIFDKRGCFIRECKTFELNGHLHILTTAESRIPMKELASGWDGRIDMRYKDKKTGRRIDEAVIMRYLRGYLTKSSSDGVNMRPFGDIHRKHCNGSDKATE